MLPLPLVLLGAGLLGALVGAVIDRGAIRWRPPVVVPAATGAMTLPPPVGWSEMMPIVGWLWPLMSGRASVLTMMRLITELIGAVAFVGLATTDLDPPRLLLRALLIADLLVIFRVDWQYHLIHDRTILIGLALASVAAVSQSLGLLIGSLLAGLAAGLVFFLFYLLARVIYRQSALGFGDVLLATLIGAAAGPAGVIGTLFLGMVCASIGGLIIGLSRGRTLRTYFAYGTYLAAATIVALAFPAAMRTLPGFF